MNLQPLIDAERIVPRYDNAPRTPGKSWVPGHLRILLHFYVTSDAFPAPERDSQFYAEAVGLLAKEGLIKEAQTGYSGSSGWELTSRGEAFIRLLLGTPLPEREWRYIDPRTGESV